MQTKPDTNADLRYLLEELLCFSILYLMSILSGRWGFSLLSGLFLLFSAILLYLRSTKQEHSLLPPRGLLVLGLIGGEGIARFQLSRLSFPWTMNTWLSFYLFIMVFYVVSFFCTAEAPFSKIKIFFSKKNIFPVKKQIENKRPAAGSFSGRGAGEESTALFLRQSILWVTLISFAAFAAEAMLLGFVPVFTHAMPHAYSTFHTKGLHYFTTLYVLLPSLAVLNAERRKASGLRLMDTYGVLAMGSALLLSILLVSRFQFLFSFLLAFFTALLSGLRIRQLRMLLPGVLFILFVYVFITIKRAHSVSYLLGIFEMKDSQLPIFLVQPYMYIANNYENFNQMTMELTKHSYGMKLLYPFLTLSGLKFIFPELAPAFPLFVTKEELTTVTLLYDAWYDFGIIGILAFSALLALLAAWLRILSGTANPFGRLLYAQLSFYLLFSFFTAWFSLPSTWFYLAVSFLLFLICAFQERRGVQ